MLIITSVILSSVSMFLPQIPLLTYRPNACVDITVDTRTIPSFADVLWVFEDEGDSFAKTRQEHKLI